MKGSNAIRSELAVARELQSVMRGRAVWRGDEAYAVTRQIWNGAMQQQPALFAVCETPGDVQAAVRSAREHDLPLSVRGGGHDWAGRALRHNGVVIDLSQMRRVDVDSKASVATIQGGAKAEDLISAAAPHGLVAATGNCGTVGMAGLTLGGGYGPLTPRCGLALDNLLGAEVVLANGQLVNCDTHKNPDLFWALRGGGGNFGVVTSLRVRLHPVRGMLAGMILFPWSEADSIFSGYTRVVAEAPNELGGLSGVVTGPDGNPMMFLAPMWSGERNQGEAVIAELRRLGTPAFEQLGPMAYGDLINMFAAHSVSGRHYAIQTRSLRELTAEVVLSLIAAGETKTSPYSAIILHHFRGAATRVPVKETSFGLRTEHFMVEIIAAWEPSADDDGLIHRQWARTVSENLAHHALSGGYPNMLGPEEHEQNARAYGVNTVRLQQLKRLFDSDGVFTSATTLPIQKAA
jgi:hypothetical protein